MHIRRRSLYVALTSILCGVVGWLGSAWVLSLIADYTSSPVAERALAAISPLAFGLLLPPVFALVAYILIAHRVQSR